MLIWCSAGGIKSNVGPLVAEQYVNKKARVSVDSDGRRVIIDPDITVQTIFSRYYWFVPSLAHDASRTAKTDGGFQDHEYWRLLRADRNCNLRPIHHQCGVWFTNMRLLPPQWLELKVGFWGTFLVPLCIYVLAVVALILGRRKYGEKAPYTFTRLPAYRKLQSHAQSRVP